MTDLSARGRANRRKGAVGEAIVARYLRAWWPDACRAIRNTHPDPGDVDCTSPGLFWSIKNVQVEQINAWMAELDEKAVDRIGLLVVKRKGHTNPGEWWCWLRFDDLVGLLGTSASVEASTRVRMELQHVIPLLVAANYTQKAA